MFSDQELNQKLSLLDARDKRLRQQMTKQTELSKARAYIGSCEDMCPERERCLRLGFQLSIFERDLQNQPDEYAMVKEYRRAGADQEEPLPHDLRTPKALRTTVDYIICNLMDDPRSKSSELALEWYDFLWDRLRAIRKDITQQNICDQESAILVERCARFHVHSCYALNRIKDFDVDMNKRNLNDCLQMLRQIYNDLKNTRTVCPGEFEFQKYDILLHLDEDHLSTNVLMKTSEHRSSKEMKFITQIYNAHTSNDYYRFFQLMEKADYMTSCILGLYVNKMRLVGMKIIVAAFNSKQAVCYPADMAINSLGFDDLDDLRAFAASLDIEISEKNSKYYLLLNRQLIVSIRNISLLPVKSRKLIESKMRGLSVGQLVYGDCRLPPNPYKQTPLMTTADDIELEIGVKLSPSKPDTINQGRKIHNLELADVAAHYVQAENSLGEFESEPTNMRADRSMVPNEGPIVTKTETAPMEVDEVPVHGDGVEESAPLGDEYAPESVSEEVVAGPGSNPELEVVTKANPEAVTWFKDGRPLTDRQLSKVDKLRSYQIAHDMPAGRFKRSRLGPPESVRSPGPTKAIIIPTRRSTFRTEQIESMMESIKDENKANENMFNLLRMFL